MLVPSEPEFTEFEEPEFEETEFEETELTETTGGATETRRKRRQNGNNRGFESGWLAAVGPVRTARRIAMQPARRKKLAPT
jgi:hypothetical protein